MSFIEMSLKKSMSNVSVITLDNYRFQSKYVPTLKEVQNYGKEK